LQPNPCAQQKRPGALARASSLTRSSLSFAVMMVMMVMMTTNGVRRYSQTTQDNQGYYSEKHSTDIHGDSPSIQPFIFQTV
jgi:hypothetical protein